MQGKDGYRKICERGAIDETIVSWPYICTLGDEMMNETEQVNWIREQV